LLVRLLPQEFARVFLERHQHAAIASLLRVAQPLVVGAHEHHAAGDDRIAVALRTQVRDPLDVLFRLDVPLDRQALHVRDHVPIGRAAPHRPVACIRIAPAFRLKAETTEREEYGGRQRRRAKKHLLHWFELTLMLSMYAPNSASMKKPGAPLWLPIGSTFSIVHAAGSGWPVGQALPRGRTVPSGRFSTRSFRWYQVSAFHSYGTAAERCVSGSHGSILSCCALP